MEERRKEVERKLIWLRKSNERGVEGLVGWVNQVGY